MLSHKHILPLLGISQNVDVEGIKVSSCLVSPWKKNGNLSSFIQARRAEGHLQGGDVVIAIIDEWVSRCTLSELA